MKKAVGFAFGRVILAGLACALIGGAPSGAAAGTAGDLQEAKEKGKIAFVLVTEPGAAGVREAERVVGDAVKKSGKAVMVRLDRSDPDNASLVSRYRLAGPQIPLVLVLAPNGVIVGGVLAEGMTTEGLLGMVPTRREAELIEILQAGRSVLVLASRNGQAGEDTAFAACEKARVMADGKLAIVRVDMADKAEQAFLRKLRIDPGSEKPVTVVISNRGQVTGSFEGPADPTALVQASSKAAGGCCSGGKRKGAVCKPKG